MSRRLKPYLFCLLCFTAATWEVRGQGAEAFQVSGYLEVLPLYFQAELPSPFGEVNYLEYRLQNRLNARWDASAEWSLHASLRTRFFAGDLVRDIPGYAASIDRDNGLVNLSWMVVERDLWLLHTIPDRIYGEWNRGDWSVRAGRQRINWGVNMVTNPNDLFNSYSFYDFAYPERPGTDALRVQRYLDFASRVELAVAPGRNGRESVAALLYAFNRRGYDIQVLGGYFRDRAALGGGWAGSVGQSGFKGEVTWFFDLVSGGASHLVAALSMDHMFDNSLFLVVEGLYNGRGGREEFSVFGQSLSPENPSFSRFQFTGHVSYPFSPIWNGSLAAGAYPDEEALFLSLQVTRSITRNIDAMVVAQWFTGRSGSPFENAGMVLGGSLKWNF